MDDYIENLVKTMDAIDENLAAAEEAATLYSIGEAQWALKLQRARLYKYTRDDSDCFQILASEYREQIKQTKRTLARLNAKIIRGRK